MGEGRSDYKNCVEGNHLVKNRTFVCYEKAVGYRDAKHLITRLLCLPVLLMFWTLTLRLGLLPRTPATLVTRPALPTEIMFLYLTWLLIKYAHKIQQCTRRIQQCAHKIRQCAHRIQQCANRFQQCAYRFQQCSNRFQQCAHRFQQCCGDENHSLILILKCACFILHGDIFYFTVLKIN